MGSGEMERRGVAPLLVRFQLRLDVMQVRFLPALFPKLIPRHWLGFLYGTSDTKSYLARA